MNSCAVGWFPATASAGVCDAFDRRRARRRGSARSLRLSPISVMPRIVSTIAMPGGIAVHQMPAATSEIDLLRSNPHSAATVGWMPKPRKPSAASVAIASEALSVTMSGSVRVELRSTCRNMMRGVDAPITRADSTNASLLTRTTSARTTRKYCGMKTTVMDAAAAMIPGQRPDWPLLMAMATTIASSRVGNA